MLDPVQVEERTGFRQMSGRFPVLNSTEEHVSQETSCLLFTESEPHLLSRSEKLDFFLRK